jgi:hypothetical protein
MRVSTPQRSTTVRRIAFWLATTSLSFGPALPVAAQPAPPPGAALAGSENTDPPPIAGSLAALSGSVSFHAAGETTWSAATLNYPVTNGEGFWTEQHAAATIDIADDKLVMDESTEFDVVALDQSQFSSTLAQGAIFVQLTSLAQGQTLSVNTPRGTVTIKQAGRYEIVAGDTNDATLVTVVDGAAHISATGMDLDIGPQQTASVGGTDTFQGTVGALQQDAFLQAQLHAVMRPVAANVPRPVQYMTGGAELSTSGSYTQARSGIRTMWPAIGRLLAMATGPTCNPGAGPGWIMRGGVSHLFITAAGCRWIIAGAGSPAAMAGMMAAEAAINTRYIRRRW